LNGGNGWWDSFRQEMLKRDGLVIKVWKDSDSSDSSEVPEVPEVSKPFLSHCMQGKERSMRTKYTRTMDEYEIIIILILCRGGFQPCLQGIYLTNHKLSSVL
jgi:hypothetical protein